MTTHTTPATVAPPPAPPVIDVDLLALKGRERDLYDTGWWWGFAEGVRAGHEQAADEAHASWARMAARVAAQGGPFARPFSELCGVRGEPARAARAREHEARVMAGRDADV